MLQPLLYTTDPVNYSTYLNEKIATVSALFQELPYFPDPIVYASDPENFRSRAEFGIFKENQHLSFSMYEKSGKARIRHNMDQFPMASIYINQAMNLLARSLPPYHELFSHLFSVEFLSAQSGEIVVTLNYHHKLDVEC